jgi:hypothetical protein
MGQLHQWWIVRSRAHSRFATYHVTAQMNPNPTVGADRVRFGTPYDQGGSMKLRSIAVAVSLAASLAVAGTANAQAAHTAAGTVVPTSLGAVGGPGVVPWGNVGPGWLLATWQPVQQTEGHHGSAQYFVLTSPAGARYLIAKTDSAQTQLAAWSGDGQRALLVAQATRTTLSELDLHTGAIVHSFNFPTSNSVFFESAAFTRPNGYALDVSTQTNDHQLLTRYSADGAALENYPTTFSRVGKFTGSWIPSPDGTQLVMGGFHGLAIVDNGTGAVLSQLPLSGGANSYCMPVRWWTASVVLARCSTAGQLWEFPVGGGTPRALTERPVAPIAGDLAAWHVGASVYVQVALGCGAVWVGHLHGVVPTLVHVPHISMANSLFVVGARSTSLALQSTLTCARGESLLWWTPSTNTEQVVLGPPVTPGGVNSSLTFPTPFG